MTTEHRSIGKVADPNYMGDCEACGGAWPCREYLRTRLAEVEAERDRAWRECSKAQDESSVWFNKRAAAEGRAAKERSGRLAAEARLAEVERIANEMGDGVSPECSGFADQILAVLDKGEPPYDPDLDVDPMHAEDHYNGDDR